MIPATVIDRINASEITGARLATLFLNLAEAANNMQLPGCTLTLDFLDGEEVLAGDLIPQLHLTLQRRAEREPEVTS